MDVLAALLPPAVVAAAFAAIAVAVFRHAKRSEGTEDAGVRAAEDARNGAPDDGEPST